MARLLSYNYFTVGRLKITQLADSNSTVVDSRRADLNEYIDEVEEKILKRLLGDDLYTAFMDGLDEDPVPTKWTALQNQLIDTTNKRSPLAAFVYKLWMSDHQTLNVEDRQLSNVDYLSNQQMICSTYNNAVDGLEVVYDWLVDNADDYDEWERGAFDFEKINVYGI